jgi:hypothetical protein
MSSLEELNAEIAALKQKIGANEAKVDAGTLSGGKRGCYSPADINRYCSSHCPGTRETRGPTPTTATGW